MTGISWINETPMPIEAAKNALLDERAGRNLVYCLMIAFVVVSLFGLDGPYLSAHFERQNQTFDLDRHVFREGWAAVITPKVSFSLPGYTSQPFTACRYEVPFHGLIGWPAVALVGHGRAVVRLISVAFSILSIYLVFSILRRWLEPGPALAGAAIWATAPLTLHFGQVPMPDILATAGIAAAFYLALQGRLMGSSLCFLFALLAKVSVIPFGLPVLAALLLSRRSSPAGRNLLLTLAWSATPLLGLLGWVALDRLGPPTPWSIPGIAQESRSGFSELLEPRLYLKSGACLLVFGIGVLGVLGLALLLPRGGRRPSAPVMDRRLSGSIVFAGLFYFAFILRKIPEPQYFLPLVFWLAIAAAFGLSRAGMSRVKLAWVLAPHLALACAATVDLKMSRVPDFPAVEQASRLLPPDARVVVFYRHYGAGPAVWLDRNVFAVHDPGHLDRQLQALKAQGFRYAAILDVNSFYSWQEATDFIQPSSPFRQYCDREMKKIYAAPHVILYSM
jgi:hypothetical protein